MRGKSTKGTNITGWVFIIILLLLIFCSCFIGKSAPAYDEAARVNAEKTYVSSLS